MRGHNQTTDFNYFSPLLKPQMKKIFVLLVLVLSVSITAFAQTTVAKHHVSKDAVVVDSSGMQYPYAVWKKMVSGGDYRLKKLDRNSDSSAYLLVKRDSAQKEHHLSLMAKPEESPYFTTGKAIGSFSAKDINGNKFKLKDLKGKVVVINFWFIGCKFCRTEIPELNEVVLGCKNDPNVVFFSDRARP